jgi:hypothetical protein
VGVERTDLTLEHFPKNLLNDKHWDYALRNASIGEPGSPLIALPGTTNNQQSGAGMIVPAPDKREFGIRAKYKF